MFKKIALYSILFIATALTTATGVVLFSKKPNAAKTTVVNDYSVESSAVSSVVNAAMNVDNYLATLSIKSADGEIDLTSNISLLDVAKDAKADVKLQGKAFGSNLNVRIKCVDSYMYVLYNGSIGFKIKYSDLTDKKFIGEIIEVASYFINTQTNFNFDTDKIVASLSEVKPEEIENGYKLSFSLPDIGDFVVTTDENYLPISIDAPAINLFGKIIEIKMSGVSGAAAAVSATTDETENYIDVSAAKDMILAIVKTVKKFPIELNGNISVFGYDVNAKIFVDKNFNVIADLLFGNVNATLTYYDGVIYANICGAKLKGSAEDLISLFGSVSGFDVNEILKGLSVSDSNISVGGAKLDFDFYNNTISRILFTHEFCNGEFAVTYKLPSHVVSPTGFDSAMSFVDAKKLVDSYVNLVRSNEVSVKASGTIKTKSEIPFTVYGYLEHENYSVIKRAYVGGTIVSTDFFTYYKDDIVYVGIADNYFKFSGSFTKEVLNYISTIISVDIPQIDFEKFAKEKIESISINENGKEINIIFECGLSVKLVDKASTKEIAISGAAFGADFDFNIAMFENGNRYSVAFDSLRPSGYVDITSLSSVITSAANTVLSENSKYKGNVEILLLDTIKYKVGVEVEIKNPTKNYEVKIILTNLPSNILITNTHALHYSSQKLELTIKNGTLQAKRYGKGLFSRKYNLEFEETYKLKDLSADSVFDMFGVGGVFGELIKKAAKSGGGNDIPTSSNINSYVELFKLENGLLAQLQESLLPNNFRFVNAWIETKDNYISAIKGKACTKKGNVVITLNLEKCN